MDILRFTTAGNVDDGKSTLIGRLLHDTGSIKDDLLQAARSPDNDDLNLAFITDGLRTERAEGITIDVAYKYFTTPHRKYIIIDSPGHFQYTKNLVTGASGADVMIILIDALNGITEQTKRHSLVALFLGIKHIVIAINKMDAVNYSEDVFTSTCNSFDDVAAKLFLPSVTYIPISALQGDNVISSSDKMQWYNGIALLQYLEQCNPIVPDLKASRISIQYTDSSGRCFGKVLSGKIRTGEQLSVYPLKQTAALDRITIGYNDVDSAEAGNNVCIVLPGVVLKRGDVLSEIINAPIISSEFSMYCCWLNSDVEMKLHCSYFLKMHAAETIINVSEVIYKIDTNTFEKVYDDKCVTVNEFAVLKITSQSPIAYDSFSDIPEMGRGILVDMETNHTVAAFIIL